MGYSDIYRIIGFKVSDNKVVCSNHFESGKPMFLCDTATLYLTVIGCCQSIPLKRRKLDYKCKEVMPEDNQNPIVVSSDNDKKVQCNLLLKSGLLFDHFTRDSDKKLHAGFPDSSKVRLAFDQ